MELNKDLAYLLGVYMGDGSIWNNGDGSFVLGLYVQDKDFVERFAESIERITGKLPTIHLATKSNRKSAYYRCSVVDKQLTDFLIENTHAKTILPKIILDADDVIKKEFIAGLFDSEGYVSMSRRRMYGGYEVFDMQIGFAVCDPWIYEFREMLVRMGVKCSCVHRYDAPHVKSKVSYRFVINKQSFITHGLYFKVHRKQSRVDYYKTLFQSPTTKREIPFTNDHKKKISDSLKGREFTEVHKDNLSKARKKWIEEHGDIRRDFLGRFCKR